MNKFAEFRNNYNMQQANNRSRFLSSYIQSIVGVMYSAQPILTFQSGFLILLRGPYVRGLVRSGDRG
jgi:hypothetical protein